MKPSIPSTTQAEGDYLKAIFKAAEKDKKPVHTSTLASDMNTSAASVTDMVKKLAEKKWIHYEAYKGFTLTSKGIEIATSLLRRQRLWKVFLTEKLRFDWKDINEIADEMEHLANEELVARLDAFLDYPRFDPHGEPIPNAEGRFTLRNQLPLSDVLVGQDVIVVGLRESSKEFITHLEELSIKIGTSVRVLERYGFDGGIKLKTRQLENVTLSNFVAQHLLVRPGAF